jgi:hypothetical protein
MSELSDAMSVLPVEQRTIVRHSADKLREEFRGTFGVETIELYLTFIPPVSAGRQDQELRPVVF